MRSCFTPDTAIQGQSPFTRPPPRGGGRWGWLDSLYGKPFLVETQEPSPPPPPRQPLPPGVILHRYSSWGEKRISTARCELPAEIPFPLPMHGHRLNLRYQTMSSWFGGLASGYRFHRVDLLSRHPLAGVQYPDCGRPGGGVPHEIRTMKVFARRYLTPRPSRRERCKPPAGIQFPAKPPQDRAAPSIALAILIHLRHRDV
jgi:hypothetical protein